MPVTTIKQLLAAAAQAGAALESARAESAQHAQGAAPPPAAGR